MQPNFLPPPGTSLGGLQGAASLIGRVANQVSILSRPDVSGTLTAEFGSHGMRLSSDLPAQLQCFQIETPWVAYNSVCQPGATDGVFWVCNARPVAYWLGPPGGLPADETSGDAMFPGTAPNSGDYSTAIHHVDPSIESSNIESLTDSCGETSLNHSFWSRDLNGNVRLFLALGSPTTSQEWKKAFHPLYGVGQWVWCTYDYQANVWRVLDAYDDHVRFQLLEAMEGSSSAWADVFGYRPTADIMYDSGDTGSGDSGDCLNGSYRKNQIVVYDMSGVVNVAFSDGTAPAGTTGWAKWCADSNRFEVVAYSACSPTPNGVDIRRGFMRSDLNLHGSCVIEEWEFVNGEVHLTGRTYRAFDPFGEFQGTADTNCCEWIVRADTPNSTQLDALDFPLPDSPPTITESIIGELLRVTCADFLGCPCVDVGSGE